MECWPVLGTGLPKAIALIVRGLHVLTGIVEFIMTSEDVSMHFPLLCGLSYWFLKVRPDACREGAAVNEDFATKL
jgi:hypothetical protein